MGDLLKNKVILISGGTKGVGKGVAIESAKQGAKVVIGGRDRSAGEKILDTINKNGIKDVLFIETDIKKIDDCERLVLETEKRFNKIDGFVNYAGILPISSLIDTEEDLYNDVFDINMKAAFFLSKYVVKNMIRNGGGSMVFIGSSHGHGGEEDRAPYAVSKGALLTFMRHISKNYMKNKIRSNLLEMGWVATPGELALRKSQGYNLEWLKKTANEKIPLGRLLTVEDHVPGIIYLLSNLSEAVTGTELKVSGGFEA